MDGNALASAMGRGLAVLVVAAIAFGLSLPWIIRQVVKGLGYVICR